MDVTQNIIGEYSNESNWSDIEWLSKIIMKKVIQAELIEFEGIGQVSTAKQIHLKTDSGEEIKLFVKVIPDEKKEFFQPHGLAREAFFYTKVGSIENFRIPKCYYAYGDLTTGSKIVILESLEGYLNTNYCLGKTHPFSTIWGDYEEKTKDLKFSPKEVCSAVFASLAHLHAKFWENKALLNEKWIKGIDNMLGESKEPWLKLTAEYKNDWEDLLKNGIESTPLDQIIDQELIDILSACIQQIEWDTYRKLRNPDAKNWTQLHGDCHAGNFLLNVNSSMQKIETKAIDFECMEIGYGPSELSFFMFHLEPSLRKSFEFDVLKEYYDLLISLGVDEKTYSFDDCKYQYVSGGLLQITAYIPILSKMLGKEFIKFLGSQLMAYVKCHGITKEYVIMGRQMPNM